ncbi:MAG: four helix bundle protein [Verrucomicrobia bacterium]|jgi:four helix bundle protein|nr:four helix bundle protein [Verrucomicrobiota bacterium]MBT7068599.1 four helix bundle protein [Verrucomicrobiota bacterium]MBT7698737.1 four helix bundle protein [Verrucomicrobiota bacterium]
MDKKEERDQFFPHERLHAYARALTFVQLAGAWIDSWPSRFAVRNQLDRAMESIIANLARAVRYQRTDKGTYLLECSLGSVLECAACLDVAERRLPVGTDHMREGKLLLQEIARMEVGLRSSWLEPMCAKEESEPYEAGEQRYFNHESLDVFQRSLQLHDVLGGLLLGVHGEHRYARRIDDMSTSLTLNIAEGNGRFSMRDHGNFADAAEDAAIKLAGYLDLVDAAWGTDMGQAKSLLREIMAMLEGLKGYLATESDE